MVGRLVRVTFLDLSYFPHLGNAHDAVSLESLDEIKHSNDLNNLPNSILDEARKKKSEKISSIFKKIIDFFFYFLKKPKRFLFLAFLCVIKRYEGLK